MMHCRRENKEIIPEECLCVNDDGSLVPFLISFAVFYFAPRPWMRLKLLCCSIHQSDVLTSDSVQLNTC